MFVQNQYNNLYNSATIDHIINILYYVMCIICTDEYTVPLLQWTHAADLSMKRYTIGHNIIILMNIWWIFKGFFTTNSSYRVKTSVINHSNNDSERSPDRLNFLQRVLIRLAKLSKKFKNYLFEETLFSRRISDNR